MMRSQRSFLPLVALFVFEIGAIAFLQALGTDPAMQVPWGDLSGWFASSSSIAELAAPLIRITAIGVAYWLLATTTLSVLAQLSQVPGAIRATSMFTLPSVRRIVDGAVVVSIATTSVVGSATAVGATGVDGSSMYNSVATPTLSTGQDAVYGQVPPAPPTSGADDLSVPTPTVGPPMPQTQGDSVPTPSVAPQQASPSTDDESSSTDDESSSTDDESSSTDDESSTSIPSTTQPVPPPPSTTQAPPPSTQAPPPSTQAPLPSTQAPSTAPSTAAPANNDQPGANNWVPTPRPGPDVLGNEVTPTPPAPAPSPQPAPAAPAPSVQAEQSHRVSPGDNLWTISRDALAQATNRDVSAVTEREVRDYWLKVIDANRGNLRSQDPHWVFPGETINLPPLG